MTLRECIAKGMFLQQSEEERKEWGAQAKEEHEAAVEIWKNEMQGDPSEEPAARQKCV